MSGKYQCGSRGWWLAICSITANTSLRTGSATVSSIKTASASSSGWTSGGNHSAAPKKPVDVISGPVLECLAAECLHELRAIPEVLRRLGKHPTRGRIGAEREHNYIDDVLFIRCRTVVDCHRRHGLLPRWSYYGRFFS